MSRISGLAGLVLINLAAACSPAGLPEEPTGSSSPNLPAIRGRAFAVGGGDLSGLWATWHPTGKNVVDSARVGADGSFEIHTSAEAAGGELRIDGSAPRAFHPFLYPFSIDSLARGQVAVILVPRSWTIRKGLFEGQVVETRLDPVMDDDTDRLLYSYYFGQGDPLVDPVRYRLDLMTWPLDHLPAKAAFDHRHGSPSMTSQDSIDIWSVLDRMEGIFGIDLFQPAEADPAWWPDQVTYTAADLVPGVVRLSFGSLGWGSKPLSDEPVLTWDQDLDGWATGGRFTSFQVRHTHLNGGDLTIRSLDSLRLADGLIPWQTVLMHEMMHVLGVGHTCRVPSTQGPCMRTAEPSRYDVAYVELLRETMRLEEEHRTFLGIMPATIGERKMLLGLPALPTLPQVPVFPSNGVSLPRRP